MNLVSVIEHVTGGDKDVTSCCWLYLVVSSLQNWVCHSFGSGLVYFAQSFFLNICFSQQGSTMFFTLCSWFKDLALVQQFHCLSEKFSYQGSERDFLWLPIWDLIGSLVLECKSHYINNVINLHKYFNSIDAIQKAGITSSVCIFKRSYYCVLWKEDFQHVGVLWICYHSEILKDGGIKNARPAALAGALQDTRRHKNF